MRFENAVAVAALAQLGALLRWALGVLLGASPASAPTCSSRIQATGEVPKWRWRVPKCSSVHMCSCLSYLYRQIDDVNRRVGPAADRAALLQGLSASTAKDTTVDGLYVCGAWRVGPPCCGVGCAWSCLPERCARAGRLRREQRLSAGGRCDIWSWTACITSAGTGMRGGALFVDLPANMLGCFVLGALSSSDALGLPGAQPVAVLGAGSPLQRAMPLQLGLRVGFCGSLTTFASWCALCASIGSTR